MPMQNGAKVTLWTFDDRGGYALADASTQTRTKDNGYQTDFSHKVLIVDKAYENIKGVDLPKEKDTDSANKKHVKIQIGEPYERSTANGSTFTQSPLSVSNRWNKDYQKMDWTVKIFNAKLVGAPEMKREEPKAQQQEDFDLPQPFEAPPKDCAPIPPAVANGLVGLDFLNIPDGTDSELPFK